MLKKHYYSIFLCQTSTLQFPIWAFQLQNLTTILELLPVFTGALFIYKNENENFFPCIVFPLSRLCNNYLEGGGVLKLAN